MLDAKKDLDWYPYPWYPVVAVAEGGWCLLSSNRGCSLLKDLDLQPQSQSTQFSANREY